MKNLTPKEKDIVVFIIEGKRFAGEVVYVTDYGTVNIVPYSLKTVWSIPIERVESVLDGDPSKLTIGMLEEFLVGVGQMVSSEGNVIKITPRPTVH